MSPTDAYAPFRVAAPLDRTLIPTPIFEEKPDLVDFYWKAWELAWDHVIERSDMPASRYLDEAMMPNRIWIWDTCFMALFSRYAWKTFPGIESLDNFYQILYDQFKSPVSIHFADNPPLFPWIEYEYVKMTGDLDRIRHILQDKKYLQQHFQFMESAKKQGKPKKVLVSPVAQREALGYRWRGNTSGMDNTPRGRNRWNNTRFNRRGQIMHNRIYFLDLLAQQALGAQHIAKLGKLIDNSQIQDEYSPKYEELKELLNANYWDNQDGFYYDLNIPKPPEVEPTSNKVRTIASFWPLLAEMSRETQAEKLAQYVNDPLEFGGDFPWPSLSRNDWEYDPQGRYWRGGIWLPTAYMATKSLEKYGYHSIADAAAEQLVQQMWQTYKDFTPHTIWETYSPSEPMPSTQKKNEGYVREDFCGWSALGPISLLLENILGFHEINALTRTIDWRIHQTGIHGIENLYFGDITTSLRYEGGNITVQTDKPYKLRLWKENLNWRKSFEIIEGENQLQASF